MFDENEESNKAFEQYALSVLILEDNPDDAELCLRVLKKASVQVRWDMISTPEEFMLQLRTKYYDVILADYNLGNWNALDAFALVRKSGKDIPFILITGALGDERAIECVQRGITDYILKDRLERLPVAISRALERRALQEEHERAERALKESEGRFRMLAESIPAATFIEQGTRCCYVNRAAELITGYSREELLGMNFWALVAANSREAIIGRSRMRPHTNDSTSRYEVQIRTKDGKFKWLDVTVGMFANDGGLAALITAFDVTEQRRANEIVQIGADVASRLC